jgi:hypothetical protein
MYVIQRHGGAYVAGSNHPTGGSYTSSLELAKKFATREAAERERCPGNERVIQVYDLLGR